MQCRPTVPRMLGCSHQQWKAMNAFRPGLVTQHTAYLSSHIWAKAPVFSRKGDATGRKGCSALAVSDVDLAETAAADSALDSFIDGWLSNRLASTSALNSSSSTQSSKSRSKSTSGNGSRRSNTASKQQTSAADADGLAESWEAVLGPVSVTMDSLSSLDDATDELFVLSDLLQQLAGSLQELQAVALQLQELQYATLQHQQGQQQPQNLPESLQAIGSTAAAIAAARPAATELSNQLQQLLLAAANQVAVLPDVALLNLLAVSVVVLAPTGSSSSSSSNSGRRQGSGDLSVTSVAAAAARNALVELAQRPAAGKGLDPTQITSLSVVLYRLGKQLGLLQVIPRDLVLSLWQQTQVQTPAFAASQLAVTFWCLSGLGVPPAPAAAAAVLDAAAAAAAVSAGDLDGLGVRRVAAGLLNLWPYLAGALAAVAAGSSSSSTSSTGDEQHQQQHHQQRSSKLQRVFDQYLAAVCQYTAQHLSSSSSSSSSSSAPADVDWKVVLSSAQLCGLYGSSSSQQQDQQQLLQLISEYLLAAQSKRSAAAAATAAGDSSLCDAAAAAGYLLPWWPQTLPPEQQQLLLAAVLEPQQLQQRQMVQSFLAAAMQSCSAAAAAGTGQVLQPVLDLITEQVLLLPQQQQQQPDPQAAAAAAERQQQCYLVLLKAHIAVQHRQSLQLQRLLSAAVAAAAASRQPTAAAAAADLAAALCVVRAEGWQQQLETVQAQALSEAQLSQLNVGSLLQLASAAHSAAPSAAAAGSLAAAAMQQLLQPSVRETLTASKAVQLLVLLADQLQQQQQQQRQQQGDEQSQGLLHPDQFEIVTQQCLHCMEIIQGNARRIAPSQIVPLLGALLQLQQQQQQGDALLRYRELHREVLAAVALQLEDSARYLQPQQISESVKLLALLCGSSSSSSDRALLKLALGAITATVNEQKQQYSIGQLVWTLWGLTKLQYNKVNAFKRVLKYALGSVADLGRQAAAAAGSSPDAQAAAAAAAGSSGVPLDQLVALLWVSAHKTTRSNELLYLLQMVLNNKSTPTTAQIASVMWSFTRLWQSGNFRQQQQQQQVLQWMEEQLATAAAATADQMSVRSAVLICWATNKLGHTPSPATQQALVAAALQQQQQQLQLKPPELSCFLYCVSDWATTSSGSSDGSSSSSMILTQQQLESLEQLFADQLAAAAAATVVDTHVVDKQGRLKLLAAAAASGDSVAPAAAAVHWDGPAVCSCCYGLAKLGLQLQQQTLQIAEQYIGRLIPLSAAAAESNLAVPQQQQQQPQQIGWLAPPSAADLALYGDACRRCCYQPTELLLQFRNWLLLRIAKRGPAALLQLIGVTARRNAALAAAAASVGGSSSSRIASGTASPRREDGSSGSSSGTSSPRGDSSIDQPQPQQLLSALWQAQRQQQQQRGFHANAIIGTLMFLRHTQFKDPALIQQLESLISNRPISLQLSSQQLVMAVSAFWQLDYYPHNWWGSGLRRLLFRHVDQLSARDSVELLRVLSAWSDRVHVNKGHATFLRQQLLPRIVQRLLGVEYVLPQQQAAAAAGGSGSSSASASLASLTISSTDGGDGSSSSSTESSTADRNSEPQAAAAARSAPTAAGSSSSNMLSCLDGSQIVYLLHCIKQLDLATVANAQLRNQVLVRQALRRLQVVWDQLSPEQQVAAVHSAGQLHFDITNMLDLQLLLPQLQQEAGSSSSGGSSDASFNSASLAARVLWLYGNMGKQPNPAVLHAALQTIAPAAAAPGSSNDLQQQQQLPLREISNALYAAAVLHELSHPAAAAVVQQLAAAAAAGKLMSHPDFDKQSHQLAACLLASQIPPPPAAAATAGVYPAATPAAAAANPAAAPGSSSSDPWASMDSAMRQQLIESWRRKVLLKSAAPLHRQQKALVACCQALGLKCRANAVTEDGCVCIDVAATTPTGELLAIELLGPHNAAINTQRPLGPARLKWRMLAARGYRVIIINTWQWSNLRGAPALSSSQGQVMSNPSAGMTNPQAGVSNDARLRESPAGSAKSVRASDEQVEFLESRLLAAGVGQQQQRDSEMRQPDESDQQSGGSSGGAKGRSSLSALERPIRRPGLWR